MILIAITGSIGCGKTTLAGLARDLGYVVYDTDAWTRKLYDYPYFIKQVGKEFPQVYDGIKIDKKKLRNLVFDDVNKLRQLEKIVHPFLKSQFRNIVHKKRFSSEIFFIDAALILELGWDRYCDLVIVADVEYEIQKQRVMKRDGISADDFEKINALQMNNLKKNLLADVIIDTDQPLNQLRVELMSIIDGMKNG